MLKLYLDVYSFYYTKPKLTDHHYVRGSCFFPRVYVENFVIYEVNADYLKFGCQGAQLMTA